MAQITISGTVYDEDTLPDAAQGALRGLRAVDGRMASTQRSPEGQAPSLWRGQALAYLLEDLGILETAHGAYDRALKEALAGEG